MALHIVRVLLFLMVNAGGFYAVPALSVLAAMTNTLPDLPPTVSPVTFQLWLFGGGMWAWGAGAVASIGYFFTTGELRSWLLLAPAYVPTIYGLAILAYFHFV